MIEVDIDLSDAEFLTARVKVVESIAYKVGIDGIKPSAIAADRSKGKRNVRSYSGFYKGASFSLSGRKIKAKDLTYTVNEQLADLERYGLFTDAVADKNNRDLISIFDVLERIFISSEYPGADKRRMKNACRALIRNRIVEHRLGHNSPLTIDTKGFDMPMLDTGNLFESITAWEVEP